MLIIETTKLKLYLDYILEKEIVMQAARQSVMVVKEVLNKKSIDTAQNEITFLNSLNEECLRNENIKDRILTITWARKVVRKY